MKTTAYASPPATAINSATPPCFAQNVVAVSVVPAPNHAAPDAASELAASSVPTTSPAPIGGRQTSQCARASHSTARMQPPMP